MNFFKSHKKETLHKQRASPKNHEPSPRDREPTRPNPSRVCSSIPSSCSAADKTQLTHYVRHCLILLTFDTSTTYTASMAASIYRGSSPSRFQFAGPTHYTSTVVEQTSMGGGPMQLRYNSFAIDGHQVPLPSTPPTRGSNQSSNNSMGQLNLATPPPGATLGLLNGSHAMGKPLYMHHQQQQATSVSNQQRHSSPIYSSAPSPLFVNPLLAKSYQQHMERQMHLMQTQQPTELLMVSPGLPTPLELSIYENKQPTGFLHVTVGNQTVEFLDGVANMPRKR